MATSPFKSTMKGTTIGSSSEDSGRNSGKSLRRSRSLSRFCRPLSPEETPEYLKNAPRGKFVNTDRGSATFTEISLDDLALELFSNESDWSADIERERREGGSEIRRWESDTASSSRRRGRSVSRSCGSDLKTVVSNGASRKNVNSSKVAAGRSRSLSVARYQISDSENATEHSRNSSNRASTKGPNGRNNLMNSSKKSTASCNRRLGSDLSLLHDDYSSNFSALTDNESKDAYFGINGFKKIMQAVYAQKRDKHPTEDVVNNGLYEAMLKKFRHAVEETRIDLNQTIRRNQVVLSGDCSQSENPEFVQDFSSIREKYAATLEQDMAFLRHAYQLLLMKQTFGENPSHSEKRKQNLLAEILLEEQRSQDLSKIIRELLPDSKSAAIAVKPSRSRKRSNDRSRMTKRLTEEAEKYFEDFISNVEDTDISSFDGERSDGSSTLGGTTKARDITVGEAKSYQSPTGSSCPVEIEGVVLPWLQWETSHDCSLSGKDKMQAPDRLETLLLNSNMDMNSFQGPSSHSTSTLGSWSQRVFDCSTSSRDESEGKNRLSCQSSYFDMEEYVKLQRNDELLFDMYREQERINAGGLLLCTNVL